jgi:hypothetical protein
MALTLDETVGGANANAYVTEAIATAYMDGKRGASEWGSAIVADREQAIVAATTRIDEEKFIGVVADSITPQRLKFPRAGMDDEDGNAIANTVIPEPIQRATMELALEMIKAGDVDLFGPTGLEGFEEIKVGSIEVTPKEQDRAGGQSLPAAVVRLLSHFRTSSGSSVRLSRS